MIREGQIALVPFPHTDQYGSKLRPVLILRKASTRYDDWLVCMVTSKLGQAEPDLDETISPQDSDYSTKSPSLLRLARLAVVEGRSMVGAIGSVSEGRLNGIRRKLAEWLSEGCEGKKGTA